MSAKISHLLVKDLFAGYPKNTSANYVEPTPGSREVIPPEKREWISQHINFEVSAGEILAIMGPSGAGKSTLLKGVLGEIPRHKGGIWVNGLDVSTCGLKPMSASVGWSPQDDVLVRELTVLENLRYFHRMVVDSAKSQAEIDKNIQDVLKRLKIDNKANEPVSALSGGQRKRVNIAMDLINNPDLLIIDEPTSGLSSADSLELITYLKEIARDQKKIVIIIIHQPSSEIYRLFDRVMMLDAEGHCIFSGPALAVLHHFRDTPYFDGTAECTQCGNVFPDKLLAAVEAGEVWRSESANFAKTFANTPKPNPTPIPRNHRLRSPFRTLGDFWALCHRQYKIRSRDRLSLAVIFGAPLLLGLFLAAVFKASLEGMDYSIETNALYPQAVFMLIIGSMFLGLVGSVFEINKDRPIFERESARGLSPGLYYASEIFSSGLSGLIQALLMVSTALWVLEAMDYWPEVFAVILLVQWISAGAGLLLSSLLPPIAAYNLVTLLIIPQIILGGALLPYKDISAKFYLWENHDTSKRPISASIMPASWAYQMAMRLHFDSMQQADKPRNIALQEYEFLKKGAYLAPTGNREIRPEIREWMGNPRWLTKAFADDSLVLTLLMLGLAGSGMIWIYRTPGHSSATLWIVTGALTGLLVGSYGFVTQENRASAGREIRYMNTKQSLAWNNAANFCSSRKGRIPDIHDMRLVFDQNKSLEDGTYWTRETGAGPHGPQVWVLNLLRDNNAPPYASQTLETLKSDNTLSLSGRLQQKQRFICIMAEKK